MLAALVALGAPALAADGPLAVADAMGMPYAPVVRVVDTASSLGPLATETQVVTLADLVRFHGHPCDGLVVAAAGIAGGPRRLFPAGWRTAPTWSRRSTAQPATATLPRT